MLCSDGQVEQKVHLLRQAIKRQTDILVQVRSYRWQMRHLDLSSAMFPCKLHYSLLLHTHASTSTLETLALISVNIKMFALLFDVAIRSWAVITMASWKLMQLLLWTWNTVQPCNTCRQCRKSAYSRADNEPKWCACLTCVFLSFSLAAYSQLVRNSQMFPPVSVRLPARRFQSSLTLNLSQQIAVTQRCLPRANFQSPAGGVRSSAATARRWPWLVQQPIIMSNNHVFWMQPSDCSHYFSKHWHRHWV